MDVEDEFTTVPIEDVFDLHAFAPRDVRAAASAYLEEAHRLQFPVVRIVHGRGIGVQREMVRKLLESLPYVLDFRDARPEAGGWGATVVTFQRTIG